MGKVVYVPCDVCAGEGYHEDREPPLDTRRVRCEECDGGGCRATCPECTDNITGNGTVIAGDLDRVRGMLASWPNDLDAQAWMRAYECVETHGMCPGCVAAREDDAAQERIAAATSASVRIVEADDRAHCMACERTIEPRAKMLTWPGKHRLAFCDECRQNIARAVAS